MRSVSESSASRAGTGEPSHCPPALSKLAGLGLFCGISSAFCLFLHCFFGLLTDMGAPSLFTSRAGKRLLAVAPKDGHLHVFDLSNGAGLYHVAVTSTANTSTPTAAMAGGAYTAAGSAAVTTALLTG